MYQYKITYDSTTTTLDHVPAGWNDVGVEFNRHETYHSVFRSFSLGLRFPIKSGYGGDILQTAYEADGLNADVTVQILRRNPNTDAFDNFYTGVADFKSYIQDRDFIEISLIDGSKENKFIARDEIEYDLKSVVSTDDVTVSSFSSSPKSVKLKPIDIYLWSITDEQLTRTDSPATSPYSETVDSITLDTIANYIGDRLNVTATKYYENSTGASVDVTVTFDFTLTYQLTAAISGSSPHTYSHDMTFNVIRYNSAGVVQNEDVPYARTTVDSADFRNGVISAEVDSDSYSGTYSYNATFADGDYLVLEINLSGTYFNAAVTHEVNVLPTDVQIVEKYDSIAITEADSFLPYEAFTRLIQLITSETNTAKLLHSDFLGRTDSEFQTYASNGTGSKIAITNGFNIRRYPLHPITVGARELFKAFDSIYNLGMWYDRVNERFVIEEKAEFYKNTEILDLGEVEGLKITPMEDKYYSSIKTGLKGNVKYEEIQGALEFNVGVNYSSVIPVKTVLDTQQKINTDSVGIELARRKQFATYGAEDTDYDEKVFLVSTQKVSTDYVSLQGSDYHSVSGIIGVEDYYNIDITPKRNLIRWGNVLAGNLWRNTTSKIKFVKSQKNVDLISELVSGDGSIQEIADVNYSDLGSALFVPEQYEFDAPITSANIAQLNSDPHGYISFDFDGVTRAGFILNVKTKDYNKKATWTLIRKE